MILGGFVILWFAPLGINNKNQNAVLIVGVLAILMMLMSAWEVKKHFIGASSVTLHQVSILYHPNTWQDSLVNTCQMH